MVLANQISPGMVIELDEKIYRVESNIKVAAPKGSPFIKTKLRDLNKDLILEKNFKVSQELEEVKPVDHVLEFLYDEKKESIFLDTESLQIVRIPPDILEKKIDFLKEGIQVTAKIFKTQIFSVELLQFLELMVVQTESIDDIGGNGDKSATLETGAKIKVPLFIESGDVVKVDTHSGEYIQRI